MEFKIKNNKNSIKNSKNGEVNKTTLVIIDIVLIIIAVCLGVFLFYLRVDNKNKEIKLNFVEEKKGVKVNDALMNQYDGKNLGVKFKYFKEFERVNEVYENTMYKNAAMFRNNANEGINIIIGNLKEEITLEEYMYSNVSAVSSTNNIKLNDIKVIKDAKLGKLDAFKVKYKSGNINIYQICTIKDGKEYVFTYSADDKYYDEKRANEMFSTFEFTY